MAEALPHLRVEELEAALKVLEVLRPTMVEPLDGAQLRRFNWYTAVMTEVNQVIRNARDLHDGSR